MQGCGKSFRIACKNINYMEINNNKDAYDVLQSIKETLQNIADAAGLPPTVIAAQLGLIDRVQLYLCPSAKLK